MWKNFCHGGDKNIFSSTFGVNLLELHSFWSISKGTLVQLSKIYQNFAWKEEKKQILLTQNTHQRNNFFFSFIINVLKSFFFVVAWKWLIYPGCTTCTKKWTSNWNSWDFLRNGEVKSFLKFKSLQKFSQLPAVADWYKMARRAFLGHF